MALKLMLKLTVLISVFGILLPYDGLAFPVKCPANSAFAHNLSDGQENGNDLGTDGWTLNDQVYADWDFNFSGSENSKLEALPSDSELDVLVDVPFHYIRCVYGNSEQKKIYGLMFFFVQFLGHAPNVSYNASFGSKFKESMKLPGSYICKTQASTPEKCAWAS